MTRELRDNITRIEQITGRRPVHFCYPSGVFNSELLSAPGARRLSLCDHLRACARHAYGAPLYDSALAG